MNILFICKFNRFRSKVAEGFFNKLNKNKENKAKSAGIIQGSPSSNEVLELAKKFEIELSKDPRGLTEELLKWHDIAIIVADNVPKEIMHDKGEYGKKLMVWKIGDTEDYNKDGIEKIMLEIEVKVKEFIKEI